MEAAIKASAAKQQEAETARRSTKTYAEVAAAEAAEAKRRAELEAERRAAAERFRAEKQAMQQKIAAVTSKDKAKDAGDAFASQKSAIEERLKRLSAREAEQRAEANARRERIAAQKRSLRVIDLATRRWLAQRRSRRRKAAVVLQTHFRAKFLATRLRLGTLATWVLVLDGCRAAHVRALVRLASGLSSGTSSSSSVSSAPAATAAPPRPKIRYHDL